LIGAAFLSNSKWIIAKYYNCITLSNSKLFNLSNSKWIVAKY